MPDSTQSEWQLTEFIQRFDRIKLPVSFFLTVPQIRADLVELLKTLNYDDFTKQDAWTVLLDIRQNPYATRLDDNYVRSHVHWRKLFWDEVGLAFDRLELTIKRCLSVFNYDWDSYLADQVVVTGADLPVAKVTTGRKTKPVTTACQTDPNLTRNSLPVPDGCSDIILILTLLMAIVVLLVAMTGGQTSGDVTGHQAIGQGI